MATTDAAAAAAAAGAKRKAVTIGTHSGTFHCDEALGVSLLKRLEEFKDCGVVRSRDPAVLAECDVVLDVGGVYDADARRFDHHQRGFDVAFGHGFTTKLSSAGLVYKHYGRNIVAAALKLPADHADVLAVYLRVYRTFVESVDANDNGVPQYECDAPARYQVNTTLPARVARLNPAWNEPYNDTTLDAAFARAVELTGAEFGDALHSAAKVWLPAKQVVRAALERRLEVDASGLIVAFEAGGAPWKEHLYELEAELGVPSPGVLFVLYEDEREKKWRVQGVPPSAGSFDQRKGLPEAWRGLRDEQLSEVAGIPGCVFVHAAGFIGGNATYEGALAMARKALEV